MSARRAEDVLRNVSRGIRGWVLIVGGHLVPYYVATRTLRKRLCAAGWLVIR